MIALYTVLGALLCIGLVFVIVPVIMEPTTKPKAIRVTLVLLGLMFVILVVVSYAYWGHAKDYQHVLQQQRAAELMVHPQQVIQVLQQRVKTQPSDAKAWYLLGQMYFNTSQIKSAVSAFAKAHELQPQDHPTTIRYAEALYVSQHQQLQGLAQQLLQQVLLDDPQQPQVLNFLAMDAYIHTRYQQAIQYWEQLLVLYAPESSEAQLLRQAIAKAQAQL